MDLPPSLIYALTVAALLGLFIFRNAYESCITLVKSPTVRTWFFKHLYPQLVKRGTFNPPVSWANILLQTFYWAGTAVFNTAGVTSLEDGSNRAISVTAISLIPLMMSDRIAYTANLLNLSSRTVSQVHISVGIMTVTQATLHFVLQTLSGGLQLSRSNGLYSFVAAISLLVLLLLTLPIFRSYFYEFFVKAHLALNVLAVYAIWKRIGSGIQQNHVFLLMAVGLYVLMATARITRAIYDSFSKNSGWSRAQISTYADASRVSITLPRARRFYPGQYIYLWVPGASFTSIFQSHPYCVTWWEENAEGMTDSISVLVKSQRGFSRDLRALASARGSVFVGVDGPYGNSLDTSPFATLILLATGVGITTQISVVKSAMKEMKASRNALRRISIIWQMDQECEEDWIKEWMQQLLDEDLQKILYCHQYVVGGFRDKSTAYGRTEPYGRRVAKLYGRADIKQVLAKEFEQAVGRTLVTVAANDEFRDEVRGAATSFDFKDVEYQELEFQPEGARNLWTFKRQGKDFKGVI